MSLIVNGTEIEKVIYNGTELDSVFHNGLEVFSSARDVTYSLTNLIQVLCPTKVKSGGTLVATITGATGYLTPETISVTMDGTALTTTTTNSSYFTYDANTGTITVVNCIGAINITATTNLIYTTLWTFSSNSVTRYNGSENTVIVPYCYKTYTRNNTSYYVIASASTSGYTNITKIADSMFYGVTTLRAITFPAVLTTIGTESFRGCTNLQTVTTTGVTTIGVSAFYGCISLTTFSKCATTVGNYAFYNCYNLSVYGSASGSFTFYHVGQYAFWNCTGLTGTATESGAVAASVAYSIGTFAFAKTNITSFVLSNVNSKANATYGSGCFSSNSLWTITLNTSNSYNPYTLVIHTSTASSDGGTYKYIYGGYVTSGSGKIVSGDYVPYVYVWVYWHNYSASSYCSNITTGGGNFGHAFIEPSSSASAGFTFHANCVNATTSTSTFKSAYSNVRYYTMKEDYTANSAKNETTYTEAGSVTPTHGVGYWWYPYSYVTAQSSGCVAFDTPITLADGTTKLIQDVTFKDRILRFNHDTGKIDTAYCHWMNKDETADKYYKVTFSDGSFIKFIYPHAMYSLDANAYVQITDENNFHVGTRVAKQNFNNGNPVITEASVVSIDVVFETIHFCEVVTNGYLNCFASNMLITEPFTTLFQNMYGFNEDMTYKSEKRKQYFDGTYQGYLFSHDYIKNDLRITYKDDYGFRAEEWGMLVENNLIDANAIHQMIDGFVNSSAHKVETLKDIDGDNIWPVTTDLDDASNIDNLMFKETTEYTLPANNDVDFVGWCCSADNKLYQSGEKYIVKFGTHFTAKYNKGE